MEVFLYTSLFNNIVIRNNSVTYVKSQTSKGSIFK